MTDPLRPPDVSVLTGQAAREAMRRRVRHYEELAEAYELRVESVW